MRTGDIQALLTVRVGATLMSVWIGNLTRDQTSPHGRTLGEKVRERKGRADPIITFHDQPRANSRINDNYCVNVLKAGLLAGSKQTLKSVQLTETPNVIEKTIDIQIPQTQSVDFSVVNLAHIAKGHSQKKDRCKSRCKLLPSKEKKL